MKTNTPHPPVNERWLRIEPSVACLQIKGSYARTWFFFGAAHRYGAMLTTKT